MSAVPDAVSTALAAVQADSDGVTAAQTALTQAQSTLTSAQSAVTSAQAALTAAQTQQSKDYQALLAALASTYGPLPASGPSTARKAW